jgi:hypothetical protein
MNQSLPPTEVMCEHCLRVMPTHYGNLLVLSDKHRRQVAAKWSYKLAILGGENVIAAVKERRGTPKFDVVTSWDIPRAVVLVEEFLSASVCASFTFGPPHNDQLYVITGDSVAVFAATVMEMIAACEANA